MFISKERFLKGNNIPCNVYDMARISAINYVKKNPGSCPGDLLYLCLYVGDTEFVGDFFPGAAIVTVSITGTPIKTYVGSLTDLSLEDILNYFESACDKEIAEAIEIFTR